MRVKKKIFLFVMLALVLIQFIQPSRNISTNPEASELTKVYDIPQNVQTILKMSCYDCHSNNTNYPWYSRIQPFGWMLAKHIRDGKEELNFSEFGSLSERRQRTKLRGIVNSVKDESMPLQSYTLLHPDARFSDERKSILIDWATKMRDSLSETQ